MKKEILLEKFKLSRLSQKKAKLLVRDYISATSAGGVSGIMNRLTAFHGHQPFSPRTMSNWLSDRTENLNSGNWPILARFLQTEEFQSIIPWARQPDEYVISSEDVSEASTEKKRLRKNFASQGNAAPNSVRLISPNAANSPQTDINGYWCSEDSGQTKTFILVSEPKTGLGKFALVSIGNRLMEVHTGVFESCFEIYDKLYSYAGVSWSRADPTKNFPSEFRVDERVSNTEITFYSNKLFVNCGKINRCETVPDNVRKLLDVKITHVLPHHG